MPQSRFPERWQLYRRHQQQRQAHGPGKGIFVTASPSSAIAAPAVASSTAARSRRGTPVFGSDSYYQLFRRDQQRQQRQDCLDHGDRHLRRHQHRRLRQFKRRRRHHQQRDDLGASKRHPSPELHDFRRRHQQQRQDRRRAGHRGQERRGLRQPQRGGGIANSSVISAHGTGIKITGVSTLSGGVSNSGKITATAGDGIDFQRAFSAPAAPAAELPTAAQSPRARARSTLSPSALSRAG